MENLDPNANQSVWNYKPWWCQPWSILLTGSGMIILSWLAFEKLWLSFLVSLPVILWWYYFLVIYPKLYQTKNY